MLSTSNSVIDVPEKIGYKSFDILEPIALFIISDVTMIALGMLVVITNETGTVSQPVIEPVFETVR
jgi:hypothetical protein